METRTIVEFTATTGRFSLFSRFSWIPRRGRDALIPIAIRSRGNEYRCNRGTDAGSMLFRCTRFFLVEWKYPTIFFSSLLFTFLFSLSLSLVLALGVVSERSIEENASWRERREGVRRIWLGCYVDPTSPFIFFVHQSERGESRTVSNVGRCK